MRPQCHLFGCSRMSSLDLILGQYHRADSLGGHVSSLVQRAVAGQQQCTAFCVCLPPFAHIYCQAWSFCKGADGAMPYSVWHRDQKAVCHCLAASFEQRDMSLICPCRLNKPLKLFYFQPRIHLPANSLLEFDCGSSRSPADDLGLAGGTSACCASEEVEAGP